MAPGSLPGGPAAWGPPGDPPPLPQPDAGEEAASFVATSGVPAPSPPPGDGPSTAAEGIVHNSRFLPLLRESGAFEGRH